MNEFIELKSVQTNNLKNLDVRFPLGAYSVVTGVSGSGKSSLVFDTLYGEAYRRYVESLSSFARQYLKALPKPAVGEVRNLPPAIAVQQNRAGLNSRSTVGTLTELIDIVRILFTHISRIVCPGCGDEVVPGTPDSIAGKTEGHGGRVLILASLAPWQKMKAKDLKGQLEIQGFSRLYVDGNIVRVEDSKVADLKRAEVVIDRVDVKPDNHSRLVDSIQLALKVGRGEMAVIAEDGTRHSYSSQLKCPRCDIKFMELSSPALLNFNHPLGACPRCQGFGRETVLDEDKIIPDRKESLATKGVACWNFGKHTAYYTWAKKSAKVTGMDVNKPFDRYTKAEWEWLFNGSKQDTFNGITGYFRYLDRKKYKAHYRIHAARFQKYVTCSGCGGDRLNPQALAYRILNDNIADVSHKPVKELVRWLEALKAHLEDLGYLDADSKNAAMGLKEALDEAEARLSYLMKMGLSYLSMNRAARTLSGGELQRIHMARSLGSALTGTLFCLDEPSVGLHARDSRNLFDVIQELKDQGNTVVVVEHERNLISRADHLIEIGPNAGHRGGEMVYAGKPGSRGQELSWDFSQPPAKDFKNFIELSGAKTHNLKDIAVRIPTGHLTVVCGVSGSGKTSLVQHTLYPMLAEVLGQKPGDVESVGMADSVKPAKLIRAHREVVMVSQRGIGRSSRSNIATYLGLFNEVRNLFASLPHAKAAKLKPSSFSFNVPGGRCETCKGLGTVNEDLSFLGEMAIICPVCDGRRFSESVLDVKYRGKSLIDVLQLTVEQARELFYDRPAMTRVLDGIIDLGLGYVTLGQSTSSFSGGEAQRLKLLDLLKEKATAKPCILIFDEPSTGLSDHDVHVLLRQLRDLTTKGHTIIVVEHHLGVIKSADWLIEVGPESAEAGGQVVYEGAPLGLKRVKQSVTAQFI